MVYRVTRVFCPYCSRSHVYGAKCPRPGEIPTHFTRDSYIRAFLSNSSRVKSEHNTLLNAKATYQNAFTEAFLPSFSVSATADKTYSRPDNIRSWNEFRHFDSNANASGSWNLLNSGKDRLAYQNASLSYEIAQIAFDAFVQETVLSAVRMYYDLLLNQKLVEVYQADLEINRKQYEQDKVLYDNGLKTRSDLLCTYACLFILENLWEEISQEYAYWQGVDDASPTLLKTLAK